MDTVRKMQGLLSWFMAAALVFAFLDVPARALEAAETLPTAAPETQPRETEGPVTLSAIAFAKTQPEGTADITLQGTVVYAGYGMTVLQDSTGGICLTFPEGTGMEAGLRLQVTGSRSGKGLLAEQWEVLGSGELPERETTLAQAEDCVRIHLKDVTFHSGTLVQEARQVSMSPARPEGIGEGNRVEAWGVVIEGWFYADKVIAVEPEPERPAAVTAEPADGVLDPGEAITLRCETENALIHYALSHDGVSFTEYVRYSGSISVSEGTGTLYLRAYALGENGKQGPEQEFCFTGSQRDHGDSGEEQWDLYFGLLHAHTEISDGLGSVEEAFACAAAVPGMDFFAVTDHSNSFDNSDFGSITEEGSEISRDWAAGKQAARDATTDTFVGIFGYEMTWRDMDRLGHINTFNTPGWQSRNQEGFATLEAYYEALATVPGSISQFNHPGTVYGEFRNFSDYSPQYDACVQLLEVGSEDGYRAYAYYTRALEAGWHVAPTNNQANHEGRWGEESSVRTVVLAEELTEEALYDAMAHYRVYATEDRDLEIRYRLNGQIMGSILKEEAHTVTAELYDPTDSAVGTVELVGEGDKVLASRQVEGSRETATFAVTEASSYYYLRVTQPDGDVAVTAPVWVDLTVDAGIASFRPEDPEPTQGEEVTFTLELYNNESQPLQLDQLLFTMDGLIVHRAEDPGAVEPLGTLRYQFSLCYDGLGATEVTATVTGTLDGEVRTCQASASLRYQAADSEFPLSAVSYVREGAQEEVYRIRGYVTAGTANPYNAFPGTIYLQDNTGGIGVVDFYDTGIQLGTCLEVTGQLQFAEGNPVLRLLDYRVTEEVPENPLPKAMRSSTAMDYSRYGGQLLWVEGQVVSLTRTESGDGIARMTLKDQFGDLAVVRIDEGIGRGTDGKNILYSKIRTGDTVSAIGILHWESSGTAVLRVRNCEEVVKEDAPMDPSNPKTGDDLFLPLTGAALSLLLLWVTAANEKKRK